MPKEDHLAEAHLMTQPPLGLQKVKGNVLQGTLRLQERVLEQVREP
tara:strand:+ start:620 stop:757 length:138 start_codon:yes stop_codon:yes gene_type:complete